MKKRNCKNRKKNNPNSGNRKKQPGKIIINLEDSESETENNIQSTLFSKTENKKKNAKNEGKEKTKKLIGYKHKVPLMEMPKRNNALPENEIRNKKLRQYKSNNYNNKRLNQKQYKSSLFDNSESSSSSNSENEEYDEQNNIEKEEEPEDPNIVVFPYEFTERIIDALSCEFCHGIYIRPYVINLSDCGHIFCLGCIMKMLGNNDIGSCIKCKTQFYIKNIKYSEVTDFYVKTFLPQIANIIEDNKNMLNQFMETEGKKYSENNNDKKCILKCELRPYKESVLPQNRLPEIIKKYNKFMINIKSENENIVSILKKEIIRRLNVRLKEEEIELRVQGIEISQFPTFKSLKGYLRSDLDEIFHYCKK